MNCALSHLGVQASSQLAVTAVAQTATTARNA